MRGIHCLVSPSPLSRTLIIASAATILAGCGNGAKNPTAPSATSLSVPSPAAPGEAVAQGTSKIDICHRTEGAREFVLISVAAASVDAHLRHGDGRVGDPVPNQPGMVFGADCSPIPASVTAVLDQSFDAPSFLSFGFGGDTQLAQTFTVGVTGVLTRIDIEIRRDAGIPDVVLDVRPTTGGVPVASDAAALVTVVIPSANIPAEFTFVSVDLTSARIAVTAGDVLALVLRAPGAGGALNYSWQGSATNEYVPGADFFREIPLLNWSPLFGDLSFRTFVQPSVQ